MIPYGVIAVVLGLVTVYFQHHRQENSPVDLGGPVTRTIGTGTAFFFYLGKVFLPIDLLPVYPRWNLNEPTFLQMLTVPVMVGLFFGLWTQRKSWGRHALFGFGFFLINLLPVLGFLKMQYMSISWVADHLVYLPMIGLIGLLVAGLENRFVRLASSLRPVVLGTVTCLAIALTWESRIYAGKFVSEEALWTYTLQRNPLAWIGHYNLGIVLLQDGRAFEAMGHFESAFKIKPDFFEAHFNLGNALMQTGKLPEAAEQFEAALKLKPDYAEANCNLGSIFLQTGKTSEAKEQFELAVKAKPNFAEGHYNLGCVLLQTGKVAEAMDEFELALKIRPDFPEAHQSLGIVLARAGRWQEAADQFQEVVRLRPDDAEAKANLIKLEQMARRSAGSR